MKNMKNLLILVFVCIFLFFFGLYVGNVLSIGRCIGGNTIIIKTIVDGRDTYQHVGASGFRYILQILFDAFFILFPIALIPVFYLKSCAAYKQINIGEIAESDDSMRLDICLKSLLDMEKNQNSTIVRFGLSTECRNAMNNTISYKQNFLRKYISKCNEESTNSGINLACCAALSVVVSPNSFGDTLCMLFRNIRAINAVLKTYDLRPGTLALLRIYGEVLFASFSVGSIDDVMDNFNPPGFEKTIAFLSPISQAVASIYSILRTVSMTQYFICHGVSSENRNAARKEARLFALKNIKTICNK